MAAYHLHLCNAYDQCPKYDRSSGLLTRDGPAVRRSADSESEPGGAILRFEYQ